MKVGFYFDASHLNSFSNEKFVDGKLGVSGTDSSFFRVVNSLALEIEVDVYLYAKNIEEYPNLNFSKVESLESAINKAKLDNVEIFIFGLKPTKEIFDGIIQSEKIGLNMVTWAQNPIREDLLQLLTKTKTILKIVFVEAFSLNSIRHKKAFYKSVVIPNGVEDKIYASKPISLPSNNNVFYLGSLTPSKGFHHIAKAWPKVLQNVPSAKLHIIGSGKLYNNNKNLGPLGFADADYEKELTPYIGNTREELISNNVIIYGLLNRNEIIDIIYNSKLACINPNTTGSLECCSVSSLEIQMCGVPIIAGKAGGNLNTIIDNKTGILISDHDNELPAAIIKLLNDDDLNLEMRIAARSYMMTKYEMSIINNIWVDFLKKVLKNEKFETPKILPELFTVKTFIKESIRFINKVVGISLFN